MREMISIQLFTLGVFLLILQMFILCYYVLRWPLNVSLPLLDSLSFVFLYHSPMFASSSPGREGCAWCSHLNAKRKQGFIIVTMNDLRSNRLAYFHSPLNLSQQIFFKQDNCLNFAVCLSQMLTSNLVVCTKSWLIQNHHLDGKVRYCNWKM